MTAPAKSAPAKATTAKAPAAPTNKPAENVKTESPAAAASRTAPIDFASLTLTKAPAPKRDGSNNPGRKPADNSVVEGWLRKSWENKTPTGFKNKNGEPTAVGEGASLPPMDGKSARLVISRLRKAAKTLGLGLSVDPVHVEEDAENVVVTFAAKTPNVPGAGRKPNSSK